MFTARVQGTFLTFEGIDGSGKTTQLQRLAAYLRRQGLPVVATREPGGTVLGERIRTLLLRRTSRGMDARTELLLMFAARAEHVAQVIRPALAAGKVVLSDRFTDASLAYQGYGRGLNLRFIRELNRLACRGVKPDLTFVLDINPRTSLRRAKRRNRRTRTDEARFERETRAFYERVRRGYCALVRAEPRRVRMVNGEDTIENIQRKIVALTARRLEAVGRRAARRPDGHRSPLGRGHSQALGRRAARRLGLGPRTGKR